MKKRHLLSALGLVALAVVTIVACSKQSQTKTVSSEPMAKEKIESLASRFTQPIGSDYASVKQQYSSLNETDLNAFWQSVYRINHHQENDPAKETAFLKMIADMNSESKTRFGVPFNKASNEQLAKVMNHSTNRNTTSDGKVILPPPDPTGCEWLPYPENFYKQIVSPYSGPAASCRIVDFYHGDCDGVELTYNGYYSILVPITPVAEVAVNLFLQGDHILSNGQKTRVLHRKSSAEYFFGAPACTTINNNFRMAIAQIDSK